MADSRADFRLASPRILFPLIGLAQGTLLLAVDDLNLGGRLPAAFERLPSASSDAYELGFNLALYLTPWLAMLVWRSGRTAEVLLWSLATGVLLVGLGTWSALRFGDPNSDSTANLIAAAGVLVAAVFAVLRRRFSGPFEEAQDATGIAVALKTLVIGWVFSGILFVVLMLWGELFNLIGIDFFEELFEEGWFLYPIMFAAAALGFAVVEEFPAIGRAVGWLFAALIKLLAPILALAILIFIAALPVVGLETLWQTGHGTLLLLSIQLTALGAAHLLAEAAARDESLPGPLRWLLALELALLPILGALALYALYLRYAQYGLTAERVIALILAVLATLFSLWAVFSLILGRLDWSLALSRANRPSLVLSGLVAVLFFTPVLDPWGLSAEAQYKRLVNGDVEAEAFDFGYLKFKAGKAGQARLKAIRNDPALAEDERIKERLALLDAQTNYHGWKGAMKGGRPLAEKLGDVAAFIAVRPPTAAIPDDLADFLYKAHAGDMETCAKHKSCYLLALNMDEDEVIEFVLVITRRSGGTVLLDRSNGAWKGFRTYSGYLGKKGDDALAAGDYRTVTPEYRDLEIGDRHFRFNRQ